MSWLSDALKGKKSPLSPIVNFIRAPDRILKNVFKGDIKKAASVAVNPWTGNQHTRDRWLRRAGGTISGAAGGFVTGGPIGAVIGAGIGTARASKGHGKLKDYAGSFGIGVGTGVATTFASKVLAGKGLGLKGLSAWGSKAAKVGAVANSFLSGGGAQVQQAQGLPFQQAQGLPYYAVDPYSGYYSGPVQTPDNSITTGYTDVPVQRKRDGSELLLPALLIGALIITRS